MASKDRYPDIAEYAFIADGNSTALVSRAGSIDWCCIQRIDSGSCFGRLLDYDQGGLLLNLAAQRPPERLPTVHRGHARPGDDV